MASTPTKVFQVSCSILLLFGKFEDFLLKDKFIFTSPGNIVATKEITHAHDSHNSGQHTLL